TGCESDQLHRACARESGIDLDKSFAHTNDLRARPITKRAALGNYRGNARRTRHCVVLAVGARALPILGASPPRPRRVYTVGECPARGLRRRKSSATTI